MAISIVFDLDYTLLDTAGFKEALAAAVTAHGPDRDAYEEAYLAVVKREGRVYDYDPDAHLDLLRDRFPDDEALAEARNGIGEVLERTEEFLYPQAKELLEELRRNGARLTLLTLGNERWQRMKVHFSGLAELFDDVIATEKEKVGLVGGLGKQGDRTIIVNDNGMEMRAMMAEAPEHTYILKRGPKPAPKDLGIREVATIRELAGALAEETGWEIELERRHEDSEGGRERRPRDGRPRGSEGRPEAAAF